MQILSNPVDPVIVCGTVGRRVEQAIRPSPPPPARCIEYGLKLPFFLLLQTLASATFHLLAFNAALFAPSLTEILSGIVIFVHLERILHGPLGLNTFELG